ncbi:MAG: hypothetical protein B6D64_13865, partial [Bacteroidetes bacterium 4484_276]
KLLPKDFRAILVKGRNNYICLRKCHTIDDETELFEDDESKELPVGWQLLPNIAIFQERIERGFIDEELLSVTIGKGVIRQADVDIKKDSSNEDKSKYKLIKVGDIAYNKMRMWQGALGYSQHKGISSPAYVILNPKMKINPKYFHYMFRTGFYTTIRNPKCRC